MVMKKELFSQSEQGRLTLALIRGKGLTSFTEDEVAKDWEQMMDWAQNVRIDANLLELVLDGNLLTDWIDGEMQFRLTDNALA